MEKIFCFVFLLSLGCAYSQVVTQAEIDGSAQVEVKDITVGDFAPRTEEFREVVSWHVSRYCKQDKDNCWSEDKQIRRHDIIIRETQTVLRNVNVRFYIQDRTDRSRAGLQGHQVREAFNKFGYDIEQEFGKSMEVVEPLRQGMEPWLIGVIAACCVVGVALIITIFVLGCRQCQENGKRKTAEKLVEEQLKKEYSLSSDRGDPPSSGEMKVNPGYDSDDSHGDKPSGSRSASWEREGLARGSSPPPLYNGTNEVRYDMGEAAPAIPTKMAPDFQNTKI